MPTFMYKLRESSVFPLSASCLARAEIFETSIVSSPHMRMIRAFSHRLSGSHPRSSIRFSRARMNRCKSRATSAAMARADFRIIGTIPTQGCGTCLGGRGAWGGGGGLREGPAESRPRLAGCVGSNKQMGCGLGHSQSRGKKRRTFPRLGSDPGGPGGISFLRAPGPLFPGIFAGHSAGCAWRRSPLRSPLKAPTLRGTPASPWAKAGADRSGLSVGPAVSCRLWVSRGDSPSCRVRRWTHNARC